MGKTIDLFKKIRDTKGTFQVGKPLPIVLPWGVPGGSDLRL